MKVIDLLNKIANDEIETYTKFVYDNKTMNVEYLIDNYLFLCILNDEVKIINDKKILQFDKEKVEIGNLLLEEKKKIPEKIKIDDQDRIQATSTGNFVYKVNQPTKNIISKINEIIKYLESRDKE